MPKKKKKTITKPATHKHPERVDLREKPEGKKMWPDGSEPKVEKSMTRIVRPGEEKLKRKEVARRKRAIEKKIREVERKSRQQISVPRNMDKAKPRPSSETYERDKRLIMYTGVSFFMVLIVSFWIINMKHVFKQTAAESQVNNSISELDKLGSDLTDALEQIKNGVREIKTEISTTTINNKTENNSIGTGTLPVAEDKQILSEEEILELKKRLEELEEN